MGRHGLCFRVVSLALLAIGLRGTAAADMVSACAGGEDPWQRVEACTDAIASGRWPGASAAWAYGNRAIAYAELGLPLEAFEDHDRAILLDPSNPQAFNNRANSLAEFREYDRALEDYGQALRLDPSYANAVFHRAGVYLVTGRYDAAAADYSRTLDLVPGFGPAYLGLAQAECGAGNVSASVAARRAALAAGVPDPAVLNTQLETTGYLRTGISFDTALLRWTEAGCP